jgi:hypothetical protein
MSSAPSLQREPNRDKLAARPSYYGGAGQPAANPVSEIVVNLDRAFGDDLGLGASAAGRGGRWPFAKTLVVLCVGCGAFWLLGFALFAAAF